MSTTPPTLFDRPQLFMRIFNEMEAVCRRLENEFPELDGDADLPGADAVDRIAEIRAAAKAVLARVDRINQGTASS